jgi:hypothetical protein
MSVSPLNRWTAKVSHWVRARRSQQDAPALHGFGTTVSSPVRHGLDDREDGLPVQADALGGHAEFGEAGQLAAAADGSDAALLSTRMVAAQLWLIECSDALTVRDRIASMAGELLQIGMEALPDGCMPLGCIPALDVRHHGEGNIEVIVYSECADALGRSAIEAAGRAIASPLARLAGAARQPQIQIGRVDALRARVRCRVDLRDLGARLTSGLNAISSSDVISLASRHRADPGVKTGPNAHRLIAPGPGHEALLALDEMLGCFGFDSYHPELAAEHNEYVLDASMATASALGLEPWRIGHAARSHAMRWGSCELLAKWRRQGSDLHGHLEMPVDLASVCRSLPPRVAPLRDAQLHRQTASELLLRVASVGLAASLSYLRLVLTAHTHLRSRSARPSALQPRLAPASERRASAKSGVHAVNTGQRVARKQTA